MVWTAPMTFIDGNVLTASQLNTFLRDNMMETMPALATTTGSHFVGTSPYKIAERFWRSDTILTSETTRSTQFTDLATIGPQVTCTTGTNAVALVSGNCGNNTINQLAIMGVEITNASAVEPVDADSLIYKACSTNGALQAGYVNVYHGLTPGENTFTCKYRVTSEDYTATFVRRRLIVIPF